MEDDCSESTTTLLEDHRYLLVVKLLLLFPVLEVSGKHRLVAQDWALFSSERPNDAVQFAELCGTARLFLLLLLLLSNSCLHSPSPLLVSENIKYVFELDAITHVIGKFPNPSRSL
jgi:hypothetical protein